VFVQPQLWREAGQAAEAEAAAVRADTAARAFDAWWGMEVAWRELPAPRGDEVLLARGDFGAVRGFLDGRLKHRWTSGRAWVRLLPTRPAAAYDVTIEMGSPPPSPVANPTVTVSAAGEPPTAFRLDPVVRAYTLRARPKPGEPIVLEIRAPTWNGPNEPAPHGVRVDRVSVAAAS
jgi:hypothetical protein